VVAEPMDDFKLPVDDEPGPAPPLSEDRVRMLARAIVDRHLNEPPPPPPQSGFRLWAAATGAVIAVAAAVTIAHKQGPRDSAPPPPVNPAVTPPTMPTEAPVVSPVTAAPLSATEPASPSPELSPPPPVREKAKAAPPVVEKTPALRVTSAPAAAPLLPEDLLLLANGHRAGRRWTEATETYEKVIAVAPRSSEAYVARTAAASLRLEHLGDARGALALYTAARTERPRGALSEEVDWGIAECHRALGNRDAETEALRAFLAANPDSLLRSRAEQRLGNLTAPSTNRSPDVKQAN
jgi:hypothetical protein